MKRRELAAGISLPAFVAGICLAGLRAIDRRLAKEDRDDDDS